MSSAHQTLGRLRELRLAPMAQAYERQLEQPKLHQLGFDDRFGLLVEFESSERESRKLKRLIREAGMPETASLEDLDFRASRGLDKGQIASLSSCEWIKRQQNVVVVGATGVGKTWLGCAFGSQACRLGMRVKFHTASDLYGDIAVAALDGSLAKLKTALIKPNLLILDDLGIGKINTQSGQVLLDVIDRRMRTGSLLITSQYPTDEWHSFFLDPTVADAILDRVIHQSHRVPLKGESLRKARAKKRMSSDS